MYIDAAGGAGAETFLVSVDYDQDIIAAFVRDDRQNPAIALGIAR
ncbi:hypothetical protein [Neorhizobium alkalisoli]|nr:hypothetical protein [Neorhizobium alkalisoli]